MNPLSERFARQRVMPEVGEEGQKKLAESSVLVVGAGGLGSPALTALAAAGVGCLGIADGDTVEISNLNRQFLHSALTVGRSKTKSAAQTLFRFNPGVRIREYGRLRNPDEAAEVFGEYDFVIDATDGFDSKFLVNDAALLAGVAYCHCGVIRFEGQLFTVVPFKTPCLRCVFETPPPEGAVPSPAQQGVLGTTAGVAGNLQAAEAIRFLLGKGKLLEGRLLTFELMNLSFREVPLSRNPECSGCGHDRKNRGQGR